MKTIGKDLVVAKRYLNTSTGKFASAGVTIASWFGQLGGGTQYYTNYTVDELLDLGLIKQVK